MVKLILVRHGETLWNQQRRVQGSGSDTELSQLGKRQSESLALLLREAEVGAIYSSPLKRALDTAKVIAGYHQMPVEVEPSLREIEAGELEGLPLDDLTTNFSQFLIQWRQGGGLGRLPGGESLTDLRDRAWLAIQQIARRHKQMVVVVSHYFVILTIICQALELPLSHIGRFRISVGSLSILDFGDRRPCLVMLNDTCHLEED